MSATRCRLAAGLAAAILCVSMITIPAARAGDAVLSTAQATEQIDGIIVRYRTEQRGAALNQSVVSLQNVASRRGGALRYFRAGSRGIHVLKLDRRVPVAEAEQLAKDLAASDPNVEYAEADRIVQRMFTPNDTRYNEQWHYFEATAGINLPAAWDLSTGSGVRVAVIDTGYRPHADLAPNVLPGYDFITDPAMANDGGGRDADAQDPGDACGGGASSWHGTHVAGTIAAVTNNGTGVAGVAFNARIVPVRVLGVCGGTVSDVADAIVWASGGAVPGVPANPNPARVLNLSLGGGGACGATYQNAINAARANNSVVVVAAGNSNADAVNFAPANCNGVITVAAINRSAQKASYSNFGATVEIAAPGGETSSGLGNGVLSTLNTGTSVPGADSYQFYEGTSMATPHVAGVVALALSRNPALTPDQALWLLQATARQLPAPCAPLCGKGILDAAAAVSAATSYVDGATLTVGSWTSSPYVVKGFAVPGAFPSSPAIGAISPATLSGGKQYFTFLDQFAGIGYFYIIEVTGFTSNPGAGWLVRALANGRITQGSVSLYSYSAGKARWSWSYPTFSTVPVGGTTNVVLIHQ